MLIDLMRTAILVLLQLTENLFSSTALHDRYDYGYDDYVINEHNTVIAKKMLKQLNMGVSFSCSLSPLRSRARALSLSLLSLSLSLSL